MQTLSTDTAQGNHFADENSAEVHDDPLIGSATLLDTEVSWFPFMKSKTTTTRSLAQVLDDIQGGKWAERIASLRVSLRDSGKEQYNAKKVTLPSIYISAVSRGTTELVQHTGLLQVDLDDLKERLPEVRARVVTDPHVVATFTSPSGEGLKIVFRVEPLRDPMGEHLTAFAAVESYFLRRYGLTADPSCKNWNRHCLVSHDPDLFRNEAAIPFKWRKIEGGRGEDSSQSLHDYKDYIPTFTTSTTSQAAQCASLEGLKLRKQFRDANPQLANLFEMLVEPLFPARSSKRNRSLVDAVTMLYRALCPSLVFDFGTKFYQFNAGYFTDSLAQHQTEMKAHLAAVGVTYRGSLSEMERAFYDLYDETHQAAFRILRDFSLYRGRGNPEPPLFPCACWQLGLRLQLHDMQASRLLDRFQKDNVIKLETLGTQRAPGARAKASIFKWCLPYSKKIATGGENGTGKAPPVA